MLYINCPKNDDGNKKKRRIIRRKNKAFVLRLASMMRSDATTYNIAQSGLTNKKNAEKADSALQLHTPRRISQGEN